MLGDEHKIEVTETKNGKYCVKFFEQMGSRWVQLGPEENWHSFEDVQIEYGIE